MTVILSRPTAQAKQVLPLAQPKPTLTGNPIKALTGMITNLVTPKAKAETTPAPVAVPVPVAEPEASSTPPVPVAKPTTTEQPKPLTLMAPVLPREMFANELLGRPDEPLTVPAWGHQETLTEAEGQMLETMREWTRAQTNPYIRARLNGWYDLRYNVDWYLHGTYTLEQAVEAWGVDEAPARFAAIQTIASLYPLFVPHHYKPYDERKDLPTTEITIPVPGAKAPAPPADTTDEESPTDPVARNENERTMLDLFRHINEDEQNLFISAAYYAEERTHALAAGDETSTKEHRMVARFDAWLEAVREDPQRFVELRGGGLTPSENKRLACAWEVIKDVFAECDDTSITGEGADENHA